MLNPKPHSNLVNALAYFEKHLAVGDYYSEHQAVRGEWFGAGAHRLGLSGVVGQEAFVALCHNLHPLTGDKLTPCFKTTRQERGDDGQWREVANRRVFYDFTISPPKSVSIAALVKGDARIVESHERALRVMLHELEQYAATRVRRGGSNNDRDTGNIVTAIFRHDTSRALDPHLHSHCIVFNATYDEEEERWKALQAEEMYNARRYAENVYYHELAKDLRRFGYRIVNKARGDFELEGVSPAMVRTFSKRHRQIDEQTRELLARMPELAGGNLAEVREHLAHTKRPWKSNDVPLATLRDWWQEELSEKDSQALQDLGQAHAEGAEPPEPAPALTVEAALRWAEEHVFERHTMVREHRLWAYALERLRGESFALDDLKEATDGKPYLRDPDKLKDLSIKPVLDRENAIVHLAREGSGAFLPLLPDWPGDERLGSEQADAARTLLGVGDSIILFRGRAGTGKSFTLRTVHDVLKTEGYAVQVLAPQRQQVEGLILDGMAGAQTLSAFLTRRRMERGAILIVDEAGQIGGKDMLALLTFAKENHGRVILSGDTGQHGPVEVSDALVALEKHGHLHIAELNEIRRQDPARARDEEERRWIEEYKQAVKEASKGRIAQSFDRLDELGAVVECKITEKQQKLAEHYLELVRQGRSALVVSPTWGEIHRVNDAVRQNLQAAGLIGRKDWPVTALQANDLTDAQKRDARYYEEGHVIVFNQPCRRIPKGAMGKLLAITDESIIVEGAGRIRSLPFEQASRFTVCEKKEMKLTQGDRLQLKANAQTPEGKRLVNGELVTVKKVERSGKIHLEDGRVLPPEYRQFVRGYAVTSYASQGKTVDHVLFSDSIIKAAINDQQWYVTISRARVGVKIFTSDKEALRRNVARPGQEGLAMDIAAKKVPMVRMDNRIVPITHPDYLKWRRKRQQRFQTALAFEASQRKLESQTQLTHDQIRQSQQIE